MRAHGLITIGANLATPREGKLGTVNEGERCTNGHRVLEGIAASGLFHSFSAADGQGFGLIDV